MIGYSILGPVYRARYSCESRPMPLPRPPRLPSPLPVDLEGNVKLGVKTLIALLVTVIAGVVTLMGLWGSLATRSDLRQMFTEHESGGHPQVTRALEATEARTERLEEKQDETRQDIGYIRARIDFLTEQAVREGSSTIGAGERAVQRLRSGAAPAEALREP